jgi:hypothetical protein
MQDFGFILTRHVNSQTTNLLWLECVQQIKARYPTIPIVIIDDNSDYRYVKNVKVSNCIVVQSEYPKRGELLPYFYLLKHRWFKKAVILHDSVFVQKPLELNAENAPLWHFTNIYEDFNEEQKMLRMLTNSEPLLEAHRTNQFKGMFGVMSVVTLDFLVRLEQHYTFTRWIQYVSSRKHRMCLERAMGVLFTVENAGESLFGNIFEYCQWGTTYVQYAKNRSPFQRYPLVKVWSGR